MIKHHHIWIFLGQANSWKLFCSSKSADTPKTSECHWMTRIVAVGTCHGTRNQHSFKSKGSQAKAMYRSASYDMTHRLMIATFRSGCPDLDVQHRLSKSAEWSQICLKSTRRTSWTSSENLDIMDKFRRHHDILDKFRRFDNIMDKFRRTRQHHGQVLKALHNIMDEFRRPAVLDSSESSKDGIFVPCIDIKVAANTLFHVKQKESTPDSLSTMILVRRPNDCKANSRTLHRQGQGAIHVETFRM